MLLSKSNCAAHTHNIYIFPLCRDDGYDDDNDASRHRNRALELYVANWNREWRTHGTKKSRYEISNFIVWQFTVEG